MDANSLRRAFIDFFVERGHTRVPSSGLVTNHPTAPMFTNAGMNQFVPYFVGEEPPPWPRVTSAQKCIRLSGKHNDLDELGKTRRHLTFFEMLGNFSFGDYFKEQAIPLAWELVTEVVGFDGDRLWMTVHDSDDEAEAIWHEVVGVPMERIQRLGDKDNFWEMGPTGPCGPNSEIHLDCGPEWGDAGGPARGGGDRYVEFWNLVFIQNYRHEDGSLSELPKKGVDTGAGFERWLMLLDDVPTVFDTGALRPLVAEAERISGRRYGTDPATDTALRVIADHARSMTVLVGDGIVPSNDHRGYIVRSVIRRAVRRGYQLGVERPMLADMVAAVVNVMAEGYPELMRDAAGISEIVNREEERFLQTLRSGSELLERELETGRVTGEVAFKLHDTFGFPVEITEEIAEERGVTVDRAAFDVAMEAQRARAKGARKAGAVPDAASTERYRQILDEAGATEFTGYAEYESKARVVGLLAGSEGSIEIFLDRSPFYAEGGGQVGDTGTISTDTGTARVLDTTYALPGLHRHLAEIVDGEILPGQDAAAAIDGDRRDAIRRNHTGTHLLHWALREVLGQQVRQQSSYVGPDRLRFDINHHAPVTDEELERVEQLVNARVLANEPVRPYETTMDHARELGAIMFFGDKYGDIVRVVEAGTTSMELCGGTHVPALGSIGPLKILSEGSIGSNMRRIEAVTGTGTFEVIKQEEELLERAAALVKAKPEELPDALERLVARQKALEDELKSFRGQAARGEAAELAKSAVDGIVVARRDGVTPDQLRELALAARAEDGVRAVVLAGSPDGARVALVAAVEKGEQISAPELVGDAAVIVGGGGGGKNPELAQAGGRDVSKINDALAAVRSRLGLA